MRTVVDILRETPTPIISVSGSRKGMTLPQMRALATLYRIWSPGTIVHGDAVGFDYEADEMARKLGIARLILPSVFEGLRAHCERRGAIQISKPLPPLERNVMIVELGVVLGAFPRAGSRGTWHAVTQAHRGNPRSPHRPFVIVDDNGHSWTRRAYPIPF